MRIRFTQISLKSIHLKNSVTRSSFLSKVLSFLHKSKQCFWKKWGSLNWVLQMNGLLWNKKISFWNLFITNYLDSKHEYWFLWMQTFIFHNLNLFWSFALKRYICSQCHGSIGPPKVFIRYCMIAYFFCKLFHSAYLLSTHCLDLDLNDQKTRHNFWR